MAIFCLTESWADLKRRIGDIVVGYTRSKKPVTARELERPRCDGGAAARRARAQPGADARAHAGVRARWTVREHRARLQLGGRHPGGAAAGRLRRHRGRLRRRPRRGEVRRHQVPQVRAAPGRRGRGGHGPGAQVPRRGGRAGPRARRTSVPSSAAWRTSRGTCATSARSTGSRAWSRSTGSRPTPTRRCARVVELVDELGVRAYPGHSLRRRRRRRHRPGEGRARPARELRPDRRSPSPIPTSCRSRRRRRHSPTGSTAPPA